MPVRRLIVYITLIVVYAAGSTGAVVHAMAFVARGQGEARFYQHSGKSVPVHRIIVPPRRYVPLLYPLLLAPAPYRYRFVSHRPEHSWTYDLPASAAVLHDTCSLPLCNRAPPAS